MKLPADFDVHQENDDVASRKLMWIALLSTSIAIFAVFLSTLLLETSVGGVLSSPALHEAAPAAGRRIANIEQTPILNARDALDLRAKQVEELSHYAWVDRDAGIAAIPIDQAIDLVVSQQR